MKIKDKASADICKANIEKACAIIEQTVQIYNDNCAEYGWDSFSETLTNASAQLYMMGIMIHNAKDMKDKYI